ncbi:fumarylacetoacetase [Thermonema lapsum]|uniref:fumarylacetoacetase n=1 Tax=Thermonema lapsum TaxID=28195 RepID=A0A846MMM8_9BACT|nr:fumarylacetoacetase [Thermonema lapsum]NIK72721.1 fumarylacetoacetase [Thermonema lapsum]
MIQANDPKLRSWIDIPADSDFPIQNIPFGIFSHDGRTKRAASRIGDYVIDLSALAELGYFDNLQIPDLSVFYNDTLNDFIRLGKETTRQVRNRLAELFAADNPTLREQTEHKEQVLFDARRVYMHMPVEVGDYTDFYSSLEHATNVGKMFRPDNPLLPNWKHLPVGYHGRSSSIVVSGHPVIRPKGQIMPAGADKPIFSATQRLDFELEVAFIVGKDTQMGDSISTAQAEDYIFGLVLFNDWSARDIQQWEYVPLGPFLGKNFASTISPWIVTLDALEPFRVESPKQDPEVLDYLKFEGKKSFDIHLEVYIQPKDAEASLVCRSNFKYMYWNMSQQLAHHTVNGCPMRVGDMCASGTISGPTPDSFGSMLELSWGGKNAVKLQGGIERKFIEDYDTVIMKGYAQGEGYRVGFGECVGQVLPAKL